MPENQPEADTASVFADPTNRGFGDIALSQRAARMAQSAALMEGAANLLDKAIDSVDRGEDERARRLVERAVALPYDEFERVHPAAWQAELVLYTVVADRLEAGDGEDWLPTALEALDAAPHHGRCTLRDCLDALAEEWELRDDQLRRIRAAVADVAPRPHLRDLHAEPTELADAVLGTLEAVMAFEDALPL